MKKLFLILALMAICGVAFAGDTVTVQVRYRKAIFECPGGNEVVDLSTTGGNTYEHTCKDGTWTNKFTNFDGLLSFTPNDYEMTDSKEMATLKDTAVEKFIYDKEHPPAYVEPTAEEVQQQIDSLEEQKQVLVTQKAEIEAKETKELIEK